VPRFIFRGARHQPGTDLLYQAGACHHRWRDGARRWPHEPSEIDADV